MYITVVKFFTKKLFFCFDFPQLGGNILASFLAHIQAVLPPTEP